MSTICVIREFGEGVEACKFYLRVDPHSIMIEYFKGDVLKSSNNIDVYLLNYSIKCCSFLPFCVQPFMSSTGENFNVCIGASLKTDADVVNNGEDNKANNEKTT